MIKFTKVNLPFGWLSNMSDHSIVDKGYVFPRAEHWFICSRFGFEPKICAKICSITNPIVAKKISKEIIKSTPKEKGVLKVIMLSDEDVENMRKLISMKVQQHDWMKWQLLSCDNQEYILEDVSGRAGLNDSSLFWGGMFVNPDTENCQAFMVGKNMLGILWMELRTTLINRFLNDEVVKKRDEQGRIIFMKHKNSEITIESEQGVTVGELINTMKLNGVI
jgi:predicted NAD-dependent protein-ADP-ribosyltransferase YbiA (DUF1768 family)